MANQFGYGHLIEDQSLGSSFTTKMVNIEFNNGIGIEVNVASAAALNGTLAVQISNSGLYWTPVTLSGGASSLTLNADGTDFEDLVITAKFLRLVWTRVAGDGTINIYVHVKR